MNYNFGKVKNPSLETIFQGFFFKSLSENLFSDVVIGDKKRTLGRNGIKLSEPAFTCTMSTIETLEKGVKYVQSQQ